MQDHDTDEILGGARAASLVCPQRARTDTMEAIRI